MAFKEILADIITDTHGASLSSSLYLFGGLHHVMRCFSASLYVCMCVCVFVNLPVALSVSTTGCLSACTSVCIASIWHLCFHRKQTNEFCAQWRCQGMQSVLAKPACADCILWCIRSKPNGSHYFRFKADAIEVDITVLVTWCNRHFILYSTSNHWCGFVLFAYITLTRIFLLPWARVEPSSRTGILFMQCIVKV